MQASRLLSTIVFPLERSPQELVHRWHPSVLGGELRRGGACLNLQAVYRRHAPESSRVRVHDLFPCSRTVGGTGADGEQTRVVGEGAKGGQLGSGCGASCLSPLK